jgi:hypothetical protein
MAVRDWWHWYVLMGVRGAQAMSPAAATTGSDVDVVTAGAGADAVVAGAGVAALLVAAVVAGDLPPQAARTSAARKANSAARTLGC